MISLWYPPIFTARKVLVLKVMFSQNWSVVIFETDLRWIKLAVCKNPIITTYSLDTIVINVPYIHSSFHCCSRAGFAAEFLLALAPFKDLPTSSSLENNFLKRVYDAFEKSVSLETSRRSWSLKKWIHVININYINSIALYKKRFIMSD